jgi:hypothetical protein
MIESLTQMIPRQRGFRQIARGADDATDDREAFDTRATEQNDSKPIEGGIIVVRTHGGVQVLYRCFWRGEKPVCMF